MDVLLPARKVILTALKANAGVLALVPKASIYPQVAAAVPDWPFILYGSPSGVPIRSSCVDGLEITVAVHSFAKQRMQGSQTVETAEDHACRIGAAVVACLDGSRLALPAGYLRILHTSSQLLIDGGEADAFHHVANFRCRAITS